MKKFVTHHFLEMLVGLHKVQVPELTEQSPRSSSTPERSLSTKSTYWNLVATIRPLKKRSKWVRVTIGGDRLEHWCWESKVPAALTSVKNHLNSIMPTEKSRCATMGIKDFYHGVPISNYEWGGLPLDLTPDEMIKQCNVLDIVSNGKAHLKSRKESRVSNKQAS